MGMQITVKMQARGVLTLPMKIRTKLNFYAGSIVQVVEKDGGILVTPVSDPSLALQEDLRRGLEDFKSGNYIEFGTITEFHKKRKSKWGKK